MTLPATDDTRTLIDQLLAEQQRLTPVERFSNRHSADTLPAQAKYYRDLIPLTKPRPGQQYGFEVNLDKCSGCKACVTACHSLNGLDDGESWRDVGVLFSDNWREPFQQTVTTACHHCVDPACLNGCPVLAYDKDPLTGIVRHLDDQCIGCQYCVMKCPYDVPKYSARRGIVRKCDMCAGRLAADEAPACVQACPSEAIRIALVDQARITADSSRGEFLPGAPDSVYTHPGTRYTSAKPLPANLLAGDHANARPADAHLPLVFMLVFSQLAVGASVAAIFAESAKWLGLIAAVVGALAMAIALLHLGRPLKAWRAFLGWRKSWFSREVIAFGVFLTLAAMVALMGFLEGQGSEPSLSFESMKAAAAGAGLIGVACSAMIYVDTRREFWRASQSFGKFFGTTLVLGAAISLALCAHDAKWAVFPAALLFATTVAKLAFEQRSLLHLVDEETPAPTPLNKTARLLAGQLGFAARLRVACGVFGGLLLPLVVIFNQPAGKPAAGLTLAAVLLSLAGELLERYLFFTAVAPRKMPGAIGL